MAYIQLLSKALVKILSFLNYSWSSAVVARLGLARRATGRFPVGRWAGGPVDWYNWWASDQQNYYYDIIFLLAIDIIIAKIKQDCVLYKGLSCR